MTEFEQEPENVDRQKVTLNELLRLKRHECPPEEFWEDFDLELKDRTLQSVVCKQSWLAIFQSWILQPWTIGVSAWAAAVVVFLSFLSIDEKPLDPSLASSLDPETTDTDVAMRQDLEVSGTVEFIDGAILLDNPARTEFPTSFSSNDLRVVSSDTTTYVEENLTMLLAESEPENHQAIF